MLATQDLQLSAVAHELQQVLHQIDLLQLRAANLAAQFAATDEYNEQGYATPIDWIRFHCHVTSNVAADLVAVGNNLDRIPGKHPGCLPWRDRVCPPEGDGQDGDCRGNQVRRSPAAGKGA